MSQDTRRTHSGSKPCNAVSPREGKDTASVDVAVPTLASMLHALASSSQDSCSAGAEASDEVPPLVPLKAPVDAVLRDDMLEAIRRELGGSLGDLASLSLQGMPLTKDAAERLLQAAINVSTARRAALASAGLFPEAVGSSADVQDAEQDEQRHQPLLAYCAELVREGSVQETVDADSVDAAALRLHDRVRAFLERQGRWPIEDTGTYEMHARPAALVMVAWDSPDRA